MRNAIRHLTMLAIALAMTPAAIADKVEQSVVHEAVERHLSTDTALMQWVKDPNDVDTELGDRIETRETEAEAFETIKLSDLVPPIYFESGVAQIPAATVESLQDVLDRMQDRLNVRVHLIGHADNQRLSPRLQEVYGDNIGLSRERAGQVAEHLQGLLALPPEGVTYDWAGDTQPIASNASEAGRALNRRVDVEVWFDESREGVALEEFLVPHEIERVKVCRMETVCKLRYVEGHARRARIQNLIAPLYYDEESIDVDAAFVQRVRQGWQDLADRKNLVVRFVGYSDDAPLDGRAERIYGTNLGLSKAMARRVALVIQDEMGLPTAAVQSDGNGAIRPVGTNATATGRALNRRVEVEFWYDDPLQDLPDEPQLCPEDAGSETVVRVYDPPWGGWDDVRFVDGAPVLPAGLTSSLERALADVAGRTRPRLRFVGYTRNETLARRTASAYGDDVGLSMSRARRVMEQVGEAMALDGSKLEFEGRGFVHSDDPVNAGFVQGDTSHVTVQVVYDDLAVLDDYDGVDITRLTRELKPQHPLGLNLMRITVDGVPIDDPKRSSSDIQRCTDVAFAQADIQFGFDNMRSAPRLAVTATPSRIAVERRANGENRTSDVFFRMYTNYSHFIDSAEVRIFRAGESVESEPVFIVDVEEDAAAEWDPPASIFKGPVSELMYVLRAYGDDGNFDETAAQPLWIVYDQVEPLELDIETDETPPELLAAYGENALQMQNIGLSSGTVSVRGNDIPDGHQVYVAGRPVPVDEEGSFVTEEILPTGAHTVEVAVVDERGAGNLYLRDLEFEDNDWFYVGMAEVTLAENTATGPIDLLTGDESNRNYDSNVDGRLAFFVNGKFNHGWKLTASADTREEPIEDLFSNFMDKSPESLFRRIDPDYYYPTFGDDGTVEELAPTMGKFFVRLGKDDNFGQWGNFKAAYMQNELAQVDRGLYGANAHYQSSETTSFGEQRYAIDAFAAEPGTLASREEFRGTGGSLYYLQRQDILAGSERVRIEVRDKASGIVTGVVNLTPAMDYDIDYIQGRVLLNEPLASIADDNLLVRSSAVNGDEAYLVVRYEYTPGFNELDAVSTGGQGHIWLGEYVRVGATVNANEEDSADSSLTAGDLTLRMSADTWIKGQMATSEGLVSLPTFSNDGGFEFASYDASVFTNAEADASRIDLSVSSNDIIGFGDARLTLYGQDVGAGYSAPGLTALTDTQNVGGTFRMPFLQRFMVLAKLDEREQEQGLDTSASEVNLSWQVNEFWDVSAGYRSDERTDNSALVALTQEQGEREDAVLQIGFDSKATWSTYGFVQDTVSVTGDRRENGRFGVGGSWRASERLHIDAEVSDGDLGSGGKVGTNYIFSDRTSVYLNYALENERTDNGLRSFNNRGREGNLVAGMKSRLSDSTSVFLEERYQHNRTMTGLTHATGITFSSSDHWSFGINTDIGTLLDQQTGAETERLATGVQAAMSYGELQLSSAIEYRNDEQQQPDLAVTERTTWLFRNNFKYQLNEGTRVLGKLNHSTSESSLGTFFDGGFTEAVLGYAYRPVNHDKLNTLVKYTYFYNVPTTDQVTLQNLAAEFVQKSHIAAVDVTYDVTRKLSIGGKYAYRLGQVSLDRESEQFFDNNANLYVLRADYRLFDDWEIMAEARNLTMPDLDERKSGGLFTVSRYLGEHLKIGAGYNFTDFSDDLTDLSFDHEGFFVTITGSM